MLGALTTVVLTLAASGSALMPHHGAHTRRHNNIGRAVSYVPRNSGYKLVKEYAGKTFFDGWNFFTDADPTHGLVKFVGGDEASKLAYVQDDGTVVLKVDNTDSGLVNGNRKSVRITTDDSFDRGLFIADIYAMPHGCSVWPAYWSLGAGATWPEGGEIDIIEGVNEQVQNQITLHSGADCTLDQKADALANKLGLTCTSANGNNAGCAYQQKENNTYGHLFNMQAGGVYAHTLEADGISVWFFDRSAIPADIAAKTPDPSSWGTPTAYFPNTDCDIAAKFKKQQLIFDITLCGDWAGPAYSQGGCPGTCADAVKDSSNFDVAAWKIASVRVYQ